jgi:hypothetical protein
MTTFRYDRRLGNSEVVSEDAVDAVSTEPWILDIDATAKPLYGLRKQPW